MANKRHLKNAPIIEAIVDIQVKSLPESYLQTLKAIHAAIADKYPEELEHRKMQTTIRLGETEARTEHSLIGYRHISENKTQVFLATLNGFTFSRLRPYETWESFRKEALALWELYANTVNPELITRVALRYINRLEIPFPGESFDKYLTSPPNLSPNISQAIGSFLTRIIIPEPALYATAVITQAMDPLFSKDTRTAPVILDIDVFKEGEFTKEETWGAIIDQLRELKNKIFFESITEEMARLCD